MQLHKLRRPDEDRAVPLRHTSRRAARRPTADGAAGREEGAGLGRCWSGHVAAVERLLVWEAEQGPLAHLQQSQVQRGTGILHTVVPAPFAAALNVPLQVPLGQPPQAVLGTSPRVVRVQQCCVHDAQVHQLQRVQVIL